MPIEPFVSRYVDLGDGPVHVADLGGSGSPVVCLHGLGGSYVNWVAAAPYLTRLGQVLALDLPGFGLSPPAGRSATVSGARYSLGRYLETLGQPVTLIANSMGGAVAVRQAAEYPETVDRLVLVSPASPRVAGVALDPLVKALFAGYALPGVARVLVAGRRVAVDPAVISRWVLELCLARPERVAPDVFAQHVEVAGRRQHLPGVDGAFIEAARSVVAEVARRVPYDGRVAAISCPTLVIHGRQDRLVRPESSLRLAALRPDWDVRILEDVGHVAMLEVPATFGTLVHRWATDAVAA